MSLYFLEYNIVLQKSPQPSSIDRGNWQGSQGYSEIIVFSISHSHFASIFSVPCALFGLFADFNSHYIFNIHNSCSLLQVSVVRERYRPDFSLFPENSRSLRTESWTCGVIPQCTHVPAALKYCNLSARKSRILQRFIGDEALSPVSAEVSQRGVWGKVERLAALQFSPDAALRKEWRFRLAYSGCVLQGQRLTADPAIDFALQF